MDIVTNAKVYDLEESLHAAGYPMRTSVEWEEAPSATLKRGVNLSKAADWVGAHDQFLTGIRVSFDIKYPNYISPELHRIAKFELRNQYNEYVDPRVIEIMEEKVTAYNKLVENKPSPDATPKLLEDYANLLKEKYLEILYTNPAGFMLTARMTTNYRCLKNIWRQRRNHRLPEWREFCKWIESLPYAKELICYEKEGGNKE